MKLKAFLRKMRGGYRKLITRSRGLHFRQNVKPWTSDIAEIKFGNFLASGCSKMIQNRSEVMLPKKGKSEATLYKTTLWNGLA
jgi:hypothetical protein